MLAETTTHAAWTDRSLFLWGGHHAGARRTLALPADGGFSQHDVAGESLPPLEALAFLARQPESDDPRVGVDLKFWSRTAKLALELVARQRFIPTLRDDEARWTPVLDDPRDAERIRLLADSMPDACRAAAPDVGHRTLLLDFIATTMDAAIRAACDEPQERPDDSVDRWISALTHKNARVKGSAAQMRVLRDETEAWTSHLGPASGPYRTCFALREPEDDDDEPWLLDFDLQKTDDLSLHIPASKVWRGGRAWPGAAERLLADLGRAARLFVPIDHALLEPKPERCALSTDQAYDFLSNSSDLLLESGFGILVPPWWRSKDAPRLGIRATIQPGRAAQKSLFGLDSVVAFDWQAAIGNVTLTREEFERLAGMKQPLVRVRGRWVELRREDIDRTLEALRNGQMRLGDALRLAAAPDSGLPVLQIEARGWVADLLDARFEEIPAPPALKAELRPYQRRGLAWLSFMQRAGLGACLADDMGLGKTVQMLAALLAADRHGPALVVCPTSVLGNWEQEIARFAPSLACVTHHGSDRDGDFADAGVVLTSYGTALRDQEKLARAEWDTLIGDEAQNIKNAETKQARAIRSFPARFRVALTGTPVENRLADLWSIFEFLNPGYLGPAQTFRRIWAIPVERYQDRERAESLRRLVQPFILRRVKTDPKVIDDLPDKIETKEFCPLTREQATLYQAVVDEMIEKIEQAEGIERRGQVLAALSKLKQVCNHPAHFLKDASAFEGRSGKIARLEELIEEILAESGRALLFTQFTEFAALLVPYLRRRFGRDVLYLHGGVTAKARREMVARFQSPDGAPLFVLSLKAGGTGLNLTAANHVFHVDRWWNPAVENQATDRAFRIGQTRCVQVHKFVCRGTLEERIDALIESKKALAGMVVGAGEGWLTELSTGELRDLFKLRASAVEAS
ncbi:MAG: DEAD/DEAH box helicase [Planctomycetes bacterium]|nr:DEAD/DEAH box helicase [Planctomycetota bacterium]